MKIGLHSHHFSLLGCEKFHFVNSFSSVLLSISFLMFCCFHTNSLYLKSNDFLKRYLRKFCAKNNSFRVFRIKIPFSLKICNFVLISLHLSQFSNKNPSFEWNKNSSLWSQTNGMILGWICVYQLGNC